jgi:hypothetical protein
VADLDSRRAKSFDFAQELTKQLITLATGIIALTITFRKEVVGPSGHGETALLEIAWIALILTVVFGVGVLMTLAGNLERGAEQASIYAGNTRTLG